MFRIDRNIDRKLQLSRGVEVLARENEDGEVSALFDGAPPQLARSIDEVRKYSITPTTFKFREFIDNGEIFDALASDLAKIANNISGLTERLEHFKGSTKRSFAEFQGISTGIIESGEFVKSRKDIEDLSVKFTEKVALLEGYQSELQSCQRLLAQGQDIPLIFYESYSNPRGNEVGRFGLNMASMTAAQLSELSSISTPITKAVSIKSKSSKSSNNEGKVMPMLHPLEIMLFRKAVFELDVKKSVLLDIFARNDDGSIKIEDNNIETHTICLFKQLDGGVSQIIIIDPSSFEFSKHLPASAARVLLHDDGSHKILLPEVLKVTKIYASPHKNMVGASSDQYRDCINISVTLAFEFNLVPGLIDLRSNAFMDVVRSITNKSAIMERLFFEPIDAVLRIKQASDDGVRKEVNEWIIKLDQQMKGVAEYFCSKDFNDSIKANNMALVRRFYEPDCYRDAVSYLRDQYSANGEWFVEHIREGYEAKILGGEDA